MKTYQIHLIRHGITDGNLQGQYIGRTDVPLSRQGVDELQSLAGRFEYPKAGAYFTSPLLRCVQTLNILYPGVDAIAVPGLAECDFGEWEGKSARELGSDPQFASWIAGGGIDAPPGGESGAQFTQRVTAAFEKLVEGLLKSGTTSAVVVAHGGTIMGILSTFGLPRAGFYDWLVGNGRGYTMRITPSLWMNGRVAEVVSTLPPGDEPAMEGDQKYIIDIAREAGARSFGQEE